MSLKHSALTALAVALFAGVPGAHAQEMMMAADPDMAQHVEVDRFSPEAGTLFVRNMENNLPGPNEPIDFDRAPFVTQGLGPGGQVVRYYNFDVMPETPAPIYALFRENGNPVEGQLNIVGVIPGDEGYSDFWQVVKVTVPDSYEANTFTSVSDVMESGYSMETTNMLVNCPIVPEGSVAREGDGANGLTRGWYGGQVVFYFTFAEAPLAATMNGKVPASPIYVTFNTNPDEMNGGPASGFVTEDMMGEQTHNVVATIPGDDGYSPLWAVVPYDNESFENVMDLETASVAPSFGLAALVNCPIVYVEGDVMDDDMMGEDEMMDDDQMMDDDEMMDDDQM